MEDEPGAAFLEDQIEEAPQLSDDLLVYMTAFGRLRHDRFYGSYGGATPIFYTALSAYAHDFGITGEEYDVFLRLIGELDLEYLEHIERSKPPDKPPEPPQ
jgi:hypothetical protein